MKKKEPAFEERLERLQAIVNKLEAGNSSLEESVALYKEGLEHAAACRKQLEQARHEIQICTEEGLAPFSETADTAEEESKSDTQQF
ncbi:MAG: exodeoxyribonuclease VII small subunit [Mailhella sp.]|nr:exodeoxyribonuclease VII small subunit [Mailhella sp.]